MEVAPNHPVEMPLKTASIEEEEELDICIDDDVVSSVSQDAVDSKEGVIVATEQVNPPELKSTASDEIGKSSEDQLPLATEAPITNGHLLPKKEEVVEPLPEQKNVVSSEDLPKTPPTEQVETLKKATNVVVGDTKKNKVDSEILSDKSFQVKSEHKPSLESTVKASLNQEKVNAKEEVLNLLSDEADTIWNIIQQQRKIQGINLLNKIAQLYGLQISINESFDCETNEPMSNNNKRSRTHEEQEGRQVRQKVDDVGEK